jgi:hypothetical protein
VNFAAPFEAFGVRNWPVCLEVVFYRRVRHVGAKGTEGMSLFEAPLRTFAASFADFAVKNRQLCLDSCLGKRGTK